tara:strand:+ start:92 stop:316 length:225 start_codon:yes stop_codon:yes gene_type:complete
MTYAVIGYPTKGKPKAVTITQDGDEAQEKFKQVAQAGGKSGKTQFAEVILTNLRGILRRKKWKAKDSDDAATTD